MASPDDIVEDFHMWDLGETWIDVQDLDHGGVWQNVQYIQQITFLGPSYYGGPTSLTWLANTPQPLFEVFHESDKW
jgi:hypothetical protein